VPRKLSRLDIKESAGSQTVATCDLLARVLQGRPAPLAASPKIIYLRSLDIARRQAALSWELRTATSLARLWREQHRTREARELLADVHGRFTEEFQTADYARAGALLVNLSGRNVDEDFRVSIAGVQ
jgi:hypothetical protein